MVPGYIGYLSAGINPDEPVPLRRMVTRSMFFVVGFTLVFVMLGATASVMGRVLIQYVRHLNRISGVIIILLGLYLLGLIPLEKLGRTFRLPMPVSGPGKISAFFMGVAFAAGWTPCIGPVLGGILLYAGMSETLHQGMWLLMFYSLGLGVPFVITAFFLGRFYDWLSRYERLLANVSRAGGVLLLILGAAIFFDQLTEITLWLQDRG